MEASKASGVQDPPLGTEILHQSDRTRVTRVRRHGRSVICKEPLGPNAESRLRHERAVLERLRGVAGVVQLVDEPDYPESIVLEDLDGANLAHVPKPLALDELIRLAADLAGAVAAMHKRGVMHRDISPANVVASAERGPCLVDFALAMSLGELRPEFTPRSEILGTLAYLAPEQTGRTGRPVDQRADLYALGATLYELATGASPFGSGAPLQLTHGHMAQVPVAPAEVNTAIPAFFSEIVMRLLEKEPDDRYQSADGVAYDLRRLQDARTPAGASGLRIGERDIPPRLVPPGRLVGREADVAALAAAFEQALAGRCAGVLVGGEPGVGKTALVDELRPVATRSDGWFVAGKFDQYRRDLESDALTQAFGALARLLLAEPEDRLAELRTRVLAAVGANAGLLAAVLPEWASLLGVTPDPGDPLTAQVRVQRAGLGVLRAVASPERPLVLFIDDLQWAGRTPQGFVDLVLGEKPTAGLLVVAAYRDEGADPTHPLSTSLARWREQVGVKHLRLDNLPAADLTTMIVEVLRVDRGPAATLAESIAPRTRGNPYETVELLSALYRARVLSATPDGFRWDDASVRRHLGSSEVAELLATRVEALPPDARQLAEAMACLGGRAEPVVLQTATGAAADVVDQQLVPALEEGILVVEPGLHQVLRFRHDRIRDAVLRGLTAQQRQRLQLAMARRLAELPHHFSIAADQYLQVVDAVKDSRGGKAPEPSHGHGVDAAVTALSIVHWIAPLGVPSMRLNAFRSPASSTTAMRTAVRVDDLGVSDRSISNADSASM